jgi:hypothetical protein
MKNKKLMIFQTVVKKYVGIHEKSNSNKTTKKFWT